MPCIPPLPALFAGLCLLVSTSRAHAQGADPAQTVRRGEHAVQEDSAAVVTTGWRAALVRDSADLEAGLGLATVARQTYEFEAAERLLNQVLASDSAGRWGLYARLGLYRVANATGDARRADSLLRGAVAEARRLHDRAAEVDALIGFTNTRSSDPEALEATMDSIGGLLPPGDGVDRAEYLCRSGLYRGVRGEADASDYVLRGAGMAERVGERQLVGHCLEAEGLLESLRNHNDSALATLDRALALLRATHEHAGIARVESRRSDILQGVGRLGEASVALGQVLSHATVSRNRQRLANAYGGLGMLALRVGDLTTAAEQFHRAAALNDSLGLGEAKLIARENEGEVRAASGDLDGARAAFQQAVDEGTRADDFERVLLMRQALARVAIRRGDWGEAERQLATADSAAHVRGFEEMRVPLAYDRGRLELGRGNSREAARLFAGFLRRTNPGDQLIRYTVRARLAQARAAGGDLDGAERELAQASDVLERWRASLGAADLRRYAFAATALGEYDPQGPASSVIAALARGGRVEAAFALAERRRARTLADQLSQADALREHAAAPTAHRDRTAAAAAIAAALPDDRTAIVEYVAGSEGAPTTAFLVTRRGVEAYLLPTADSLDGPIERFAALLEGGDQADQLARSLGRTVLGPIAASAPRIARLIAVPDGPLHRLTFDALVLPDGRRAVERWAIGLAPSAAVATVLRAPASPDTAGPRLLAFGDPAFAHERSAASSREAERYRGAFDAAGGLPRLAGSGDEVREVARYAAASEVRLRSDASEAWLKHAEVGRFRVIHLATHALVDESSLARTSLALAPGGGEDGFVSPADLASLRLDADLVVLSACRTAGGLVVAGEGVQGLTTPLLAAGARSVVATQWRVGDRSTVRLVRDLYDALARGMPVADALREAKLAAIRRGAAPGEWAGFTVVGDPTVTVPLHRPPARRWAWGAGAAIVLLAAAAALARRRAPGSSAAPSIGA